MPVGRKTSIAIPTVILRSKNREIKFSFLRGLADTDFSLTFQKKNKNRHFYPILKTALVSEEVVRDSARLLKENGFKVHIEIGRKNYDKRTRKFYITNCLYMSGKRNLELWMKMIGFNNPKNITKYQIWKKFSFCPPRTSLSQRKSILTNKLNPNLLYAPDG